MTLKTVRVDCQYLMDMLIEAKKMGLGGMEKWAEIAIEFIRQQDHALKDARDGLRELLIVREDTRRLDYMERHLRREGSQLIAEGQMVQPRNAWAIASELATLRETIDVLMKQTN